MEDKGLMGSAGVGLGRAIVLAGAIAVLCASLAVGSSSPSPPNIGFVGEWGEAGSGPGEFGFPVSVAVHGSGNVYVADSENDRIQRFDTDGDLLGEWGESGNGPGQFAIPEAVEVDNFGNVYVADKGNDRIEKFSSSGGLVAQWGGAGKAAGELDGPSGVAVGKEGDVYVADSGNDRIQKFTEAGRFVSRWGKTGGDPGELDFPTAVATDAAGRIFVADTGNDRIERFDQSGEFLDEWGIHGNAPGQFDSPVALSVAGGGGVFVADAGNDRIQVFGKLPRPAYGKSFNVGAVSGVVRVHLPGTTKFVVLGGDRQLPIGTIVDTNHGRVRLSSAKGPGGGTQSADFFSGTFRVLQPKGGRPITVLKLENAIVCPLKKGKRDLGATLSSSKNRGLWGSGKGNFRSEGKHGSATVRGTIWWAQDTCEGTLFRVKRGIVTVKVFSSGRTLKLHAGQRYLAPNG